MTRSQIARVLREAAVYAHYADREYGPNVSVLMVTKPDSAGQEWRHVVAAFQRCYDWHTGEWTRDITVLALLFAAEAVEGVC